MSRQPLFLICLAVLQCLYCTAGQYEIEECDPNVANLQLDICNQLNSNHNVPYCMPYQCDKATRRCVQKPRDYDRDGEADQGICQGTDCDDTDPSIYSTAIEICDNRDNNCKDGKDEGCTCKPELIGTTCYDGKGACQRPGKFLCQNNVPVCDAKAADPQSWHNYLDLVNQSEDWNCDGVVETTCCTDSSCAQVIDCERIDCNRGSASEVCQSMFCNNFNLTNCNGKSRTYRCDDTCGGRLLTCNCSFSLSCKSNNSIYTNNVGCR